MISRIMGIWTAVETVLIGCLILSALFVFLGGAALRAFAPIYAVDWAEEVALYCVIWATILSGSSLVAQNRHISAEIIVATLPATAQTIIGWGVTVLTVVFCGAMMFYGWQAFEFALLLDERSASSLRTPQGHALFLALPVGMALILGRVALMLLEGERPFGDHTRSSSFTN